MDSQAVWIRRTNSNNDASRFPELIRRPGGEEERRTTCHVGTEYGKVGKELCYVGSAGYSVQVAIATMAEAQ